MSNNPVGGVGGSGTLPPSSPFPPSSSSSSTGTGSSQDVTGTNTFLQLLVAQLRNQDPMQPMNDQSFITELAQFNSVEQTLNLTKSVDSELSAQQATQAVSMLGKTVTYTTPGINGASGTSSQGIVSSVSLQNGQVQLEIGTQSVPLSEVTAVSS